MLSEKELERFMSKVDKTGSCWLWTACVGNHGYGCFSLNNKTKTAHKLAYVQYTGEVPEGLFVLHECDNRKCVNPDHLFLGTNQDNVDDMLNKNRSLKGSDHSQAKLNNNQVLGIIKLSQHIPRKELADIYKVGVRVIGDILNGVTWTHLTNIKYKSRRLTEEIVLKIKSLFPTHTNREIADLFDRSVYNIYSIRIGKTWGHI